MKTCPPHADLRNRQYCDWRDFLSQADRWDSDQISLYQLAQLRSAVRYAYDRTPGYRTLFHRVGFEPCDLQTLNDLRRFPLVEKEQLRDELDRFTAFKKGAKYITTGGSTGIPFGFYREPEAFAKELASKAHQYQRVGWHEGDPQLVFRGLAVNAKCRIQLYPRFNELRCSSYHLTSDRMEAYRQAAWRYRPDWLRCYPSSGALFARFLGDTGRDFPPLKGILCASENLYESQKQLLRETFQCRVFSHYGHYELSVLAGFCEHADTYHVLPQYGYAELLDTQGESVRTPGQIGEIVATSFILKATPFVRYRTRDYAVFRSTGCPECGRPYEVWERIEGRLQEFVVTGTGRWISMTAINMHDDIFDTIQQFQFHQEEQGRVTFNYIPKEKRSLAIEADMKHRLLAKFGDDVDLAVQPVEEIPVTARGKHRFLIQKLQLTGHDV